MLTTEETAQRLRTTVAGINQLVAQGKLSAYRLGGEFVRFRKDEVEALARTARQHHAPPAPLPSSAVNAGWRERLREFFYLHDFYLMAALLALLLIAVLIRFA